MFGSSNQAICVCEPREGECELIMSEEVTPDATEISDFTHFDQNLPPEMEAYVRQKVVRLPRGYYDRWADKLGPYE